jgi:hypothetical protein
MATPLRAVPGTGRLSRAAGWLHRLRRTAKVPASLRSLADYPLTVAGLACIDWGVCTASITAGLITAGLSLIGLEYLIADED